MKSTREIYDPGIASIRESNQQYRCDKINNRLIYRGIVTFVDRIGNDSRPAFSLKARVFGIDDPFPDGTSENFYPPLFPPHLISIPEVSEEILIICEEVGNLKSGFWISRVNYNNSLTLIPVGSDDKEDSTVSDKFGIESEKLPEETTDTSPNADYPIPEIRFKPGDIPMQGRSNTLIKHSFDSVNKKGYIEILTEGQGVDDANFFSEDFQKSNGSRIIVATLSNLDNLITNNIGKTFSSTFSGIKNTNSAYLLLESSKVRLISRDGGNVQSAVLAENQEIWLKALTEQIVKLTDEVDKLKSKYDGHSHDQGSYNIPGVGTVVGSSAGATSSGVNVSPIKSAVNDLNPKIKDHHSKNVALN